jgi:hypothetical protein
MFLVAAQAGGLTAPLAYAQTKTAAPAITVYQDPG